MENNEHSRRDVAEKKYHIEQAEERSHKKSFGVESFYYFFEVSEMKTGFQFRVKRSIKGLPFILTPHLSNPKFSEGRPTKLKTIQSSVFDASSGGVRPRCL